MSALRQHVELSEFVSEEEYFRLCEASEERLEYIDGRIYPKNNPLGLVPEAMAGASDKHVDLATTLTGLLFVALRDSPCFVVNNDQKVKSENSYSFPDLTVYCEEREKDEQGNLTNPVVLFEVLSPATEHYDRHLKFDKLRLLPSLQDYLLVSQDRILIEHRHRRAENRWDLIYYNRPDDDIVLESIGVTLSLAEIYERISFED